MVRGLQRSSTPCLSGQRRDEDSGRVTVPKVAIQVNPTTTPIAELSERPHAARRGFIERPRLVSRLVETPEASVAVLIAPAGYGKSTLLSGWEQLDKRPFAWVMLDERHNDPTFLLGSITRSLNEIEPIDESVLAALTTSRPSIAKVVVPRLGEVLQERDRSFVLVLDDVHTVTDADALDALTALTERIPSGSRLVLASRTRPPVKLGRLRADHRLLELDAADLLMTRLEARQTLRACGVEVSPEVADRIVDKTEGWPAGIYLATVAIGDAEDVEVAIGHFAGDDRLVADYLQEEFLTGLPASDLDFLTRSSVLDRLSGPVCDMVLQREGSGEKLRELSRSNLLLVPLDRKDEQFRYHALLRQMLEGELNRLGEQAAQDLHSRAAHWYTEHGDVDRAVNHAIRSGRVDQAGGLIWAHTGPYVAGGREATIRRWIESFPEERVRSTPMLALARATTYLSHGNGGQVEHWTELAQGSLGGLDAPQRMEMEVAATMLRATAVPRHGIRHMGEEMHGVNALVPGESPWKSLCCMVEGVAHQLSGEPDAARQLLEEGARRGAVAAPAVEALCLAQLALLALDLNDAARADELASGASNRAHRFGLENEASAAVVFAASALVMGSRGRIEDAVRHVKVSTRMVETFRDLAPWYEAEARITLARALLQLDDAAHARAHLADAGAYMSRVEDAPVLTRWLEDALELTDQVAAAPWPLTAAELRVLHLLPTHLSYSEIADRLSVSTNTAKTHAKAIYRKLDVSSRTEAVDTAQAAGLIREPAPPA